MSDDAIEATLTAYSSNSKGERRLTFCVQKDDAKKVNALADLVGHSFGLGLAHITQRVSGGTPNVAGKPDGHKVGSIESLVAISAEHRITPGASDATYVVDGPAPVDRPVRAPPPLNVGKDSSTPEFIGWLSDYRRIPMDKESTAKFVRAFCEVRSRKDIVRGSPAEQKWNLLYSAFLTDNPPP